MSNIEKRNSKPLLNTRLLLLSTLTEWLNYSRFDSFLLKPQSAKFHYKDDNTAILFIENGLTHVFVSGGVKVDETNVPIFTIDIKVNYYPITDGGLNTRFTASVNDNAFGYNTIPLRISTEVYKLLALAHEKTHAELR